MLHTSWEANRWLLLLELRKRALPLRCIAHPLTLVRNWLNLCLICASANVTLSIGFNTISRHALCTIGFIGLPMLACWLLCIPRSMNFAGWFGIPATISIRKSLHPKTFAS
jgi:hypothetical protein